MTAFTYIIVDFSFDRRRNEPVQVFEIGEFRRSDTLALDELRTRENKPSIQKRFEEEIAAATQSILVFEHIDEPVMGFWFQSFAQIGCQQYNYRSGYCCNIACEAINIKLASIQEEEYTRTKFKEELLNDNPAQTPISACISRPSIPRTATPLLSQSLFKPKTVLLFGNMASIRALGNFFNYNQGVSSTELCLLFVAACLVSILFDNNKELEHTCAAKQRL